MKMKKLLKVVLISLASLISVGIIAILVIASLEKVIYKDFFSNSKEIVSIYGLEEGYIPQGFTYSPQEDVFLSSGYLVDEASRIYVTEVDNSSSKYVKLMNSDDTPFLGHCGGIGVYYDNVYVACDDEGYNKVFTFSLSEIINSDNDGTVKVKDEKELDINPAYICVHQNTLLIGEFYKEGSKYLTNKEHHLQTSSGETNFALCYAFKLNEETHDTSWEIDYVLSLPEKVQGLAILNDKQIAISTSWSIFSSNLYIYDNVFDKTESYQENNLYYLDQGHLSKAISMPPMSEEIQVYNDMLLVNFESACKKYRFVNVYRQTSILGYKF